MNTIATPVALPDGDRRTTVPLFTLHECARYLHTPLSTLHSWAKPRGEVPLITTLPGAGRQATIPFVGFAEAFVLGALRKAGVPMQRIRPAVKQLNDEIGLDHALASERVYTDGAELIFNDGWVAKVRLPAYTHAEVTVDPTEAFGQPLLVHGGARVEDLVDRFKAGDGFADIAADFDVPSDEVEDVLRVALRLPA